MPTVRYDGQTLMIGSRRIWLVSGAIHYARVPQALWRSRIRAAKQAGLNCIETHVFWAVHEPRPSAFRFDGDLDLRRFVQTVGEEGLYCILRPGPYVGAQWDFGGLPPWLHRVKSAQLRQANGPFKEACARYLAAVMDRVKDLQMTDATHDHPSKNAAIVLVQAENAWFCDSPQQVQGYMEEIVRYLRETGCTVPITESNNLWNRVDGTFTCWNSESRLAGDLRQLRVVQSHAPRLVADCWSGRFDQWGHEHRRHLDDGQLLHRLASILAVGAQFNLYMFHGGTNFAFHGGRTLSSRAGFVATTYGYDAPLLEAGGRGPKYLATKRLCTFASQFASTFCHLDPDHQPAIPNLDNTGHSLAIVHQRGSRGDVVFLFQLPHAPAKDHVDLLLPNGLTLPVPIGTDRVAWLLLDCPLGGVARLNYTNLRPWAFLADRALVLFGPPGSRGVVCVNNATARLTVPTGQTPAVEQHENLTLVVLNTQQVDATHAGPDGLIVGCAGLDEHDQPLPLEGWRHPILVSHDGRVSKLAPTPPRRAAAPRLKNWQQATLTDLLDGSSTAYQGLEGPASFEALECDYGYGWYRLSLPSTVKAAVLAPEAGDRLHLYGNAQLIAVLGHGPGAQFDPQTLTLDKHLVALADNLGRFNEGWLMGENKGLFGHLYKVKPLTLGKPKIVPGKAPDLLAFKPFLAHVRWGEQPPSDALVWSIKPIGRNPVIVDLDQFPWRTMLLINNHPVGVYDPVLTAGFARLVLHWPDHLKASTNELKLALFGKFDPVSLPGKKLSSHLRVYQVTDNLTAKATWAFAPWSLPATDRFEPLRRKGAAQPRWYRCNFVVTRTDTPLWLEPVGMTKGQLYINGHNAGRYFISTHTGKPVPPQKRYYLPEPWLKTTGFNELLLFDEHGASPHRCRLVYDPMGPYGA